MSSLYFLGNDTSYLRIPNTSDFNFGTGDFTIEWYQYQNDSNPFPRIFQVGSYSSNISIGVSIEGGSFYYWTNNTPNYVSFLDSSTYKNKWVHFAISRSSGTTTIFMNGSSMFSMEDTNNFSGSNDLIISNETELSNIASFGGYMTYFSWIKGTGLYTSNFTVSNTYPTTTGVLLLKANSFLGTLGNTVVNNNVSTINQVPPNFETTPTPPPPPTPRPPSNVKPNFRNIGSLFTDNSMVYYKRGTLAAGGIGTVRNSFAKSKRI